MSQFSAIAEMLSDGDAKAPAIGAPDRRDMSRGELAALARRVGADLRGIGIARRDAVAIVMPNGPEMAAAFLAVAANCVAAPLNAAYRADEFDFYLSDLDAQALILPAGAESPAREIAAKRKIRVIELAPDLAGPAGAFSLSVPAGGDVADAASPDDVALVLHTSGTTSRPKIVPLTQRNLMTSAGNIARTLALTPRDRSLVIMPLFHIHGLVGALLSSLHAGGSVFCPSGFNALKFFAQLDEAAATWYSAVPTMHQTVLARAKGNAEIIARRKLRFIRSSSASLPPPVMKELEATFGCPVIESYGMTEAAHQMASNPLPPAARKPGSVGIAAGPEVAIMGEDGLFLKSGEVGEIVIRGANVTPGYANNPKANAEAFRDGWFRTGDQGVMDGEGYVSLTGRLKEIINRGGEKISPREVDDVLMEHPAVAQIVTFAMPHDKLGEEVAAAVVLKDGTAATERDLREFAAQRLADFKVPKKILFLAEIPKGATGKLQRIGLAQKLGLSS
ncbi:acyl-CoA synthetase (AMP-forming)/AMP-acid ligase II [Dongia mobilis]|uniref:Acyl-CoA synthetase (AMP-forming)/AMP-acid ligase II n=1 Tax=Dongia mobilis TaxID=578943 RepID=A0A4V3DEC5_9PROT|nr:acyl--CoA ligase [Dongia mobilis]TDQ80621.1 acyl-CoA synthetase (AMP-forming)/AMP-acid ligase II [Dongia mobilis]